MQRVPAPELGVAVAAVLNHLDRLRTGRECANVAVWFTRRPNFRLRCTRTYGSWLIQIESWFARITTQAIRRDLLDLAANLKRKVRLVATHYNRHPRLFM